VGLTEYHGISHGMSHEISYRVNGPLVTRMCIIPFLLLCSSLFASGRLRFKFKFPFFSLFAICSFSLSLSLSLSSFLPLLNLPPFHLSQSVLHDSCPLHFTKENLGLEKTLQAAQLSHARDGGANASGSRN
jgi:hypothetical protein